MSRLNIGRRIFSVIFHTLSRNKCEKTKFVYECVSPRAGGPSNRCNNFR